MESFFSRIKTTKVRASQSLFQLQSRPFELFPAPVWKRYSSLSSTCLLPLLYLETEMFDLSPSRFPFLAPFPSPGSFPQALSVVQTSPNHSHPRNSSTTRDFWPRSKCWLSNLWECLAFSFLVTQTNLTTSNLRPVSWRTLFITC